MVGQSLSRFLVRERPQIAFSNWQGHRLGYAAGRGCKLGSMALMQGGTIGCIQRLHSSGSLVMWGQRLCSTVGQGCRLGSMPKSGYRMGSEESQTKARILEGCLA